MLATNFDLPIFLQYILYVYIYIYMYIVLVYFYTYVGIYVYIFIYTYFCAPLQGSTHRN